LELIMKIGVVFPQIEFGSHPAEIKDYAQEVEGMGYMHILGTTEENLLGVLCGQPTSRQREAEFSAQGSSVEPIRQTWLELRERIEQGLAGLPPGELEREHKHPRRGLLLGREVLVVVTRHAVEHMGQAELTRDLFFAAQGKTPPQREY
jgi:hypothetical protein